MYDDPGAQCIVDLQHGALEALRGTGYELVVHPCDSQDPECARGVRRFVQQQKLHGVILGPRASESVALAQMLDDIDCRYVRINAHASEEDVQAVVTHDRDGAAAAAGYLLSLGHRDIAVIAGPGDRRAARERTHGFLDRLAQVGLTLPGERVLEAGDTFESGVHAAERLLLGGQRPSAIFAGNDEMAAGVYQVALRAGIAVPQQLSIVSYDDSPLASRLWPPLTSVRRHVSDIGRTAAAMLVQTDVPDAPTAASVHPQLMVRGSCRAVDG